jgi:ATP synthase protein I
MSGDGSQDGHGSGRKDPEDVELSARLQRLEKRLGEVRGEETERKARQESGGGDPAGMGKAFRLSAEFMAGIIAGAGLGYAIDKISGSSPWGLMILTVLGFCAGIYNVMRAAGFVRPQRPPGGDAGQGRRPGGGDATGQE